ncbi:hypothetical protein [Nocardioides sp.]|uniref:hypothetical protein n=1 Tax=Nocardioides sp. TaxID=35761 RepID=UPI0025E5B40B|nr:hypothetical protein [Nocardioides sp.]
MRLRPGVVGLALAAMAASACTSARTAPDPDEAPLRPTWSEVRLPAGFEPSLLAPGPADDLVVAADGAVDGRRPPELLDLTGTTVTSVPVRPAGFYGRRTVWRGFAAAGRSVYAFGGRSGGAHGNTRWTAWSGTAGPHGRLAEDVQDFETFGGPTAGGLSALVAPPGAPPILLGSRVSEAGSGLDVALWDLADGRWVRRPSSGTALAADDDQQPSAHALALRGDGLLVAGSITSFGGGVRTQAAVWTAPTTEGPWTSLLLPTDGDTASSAETAVCSTDGSCLVAGYAGQRLAAWAVRSDGAATALDLPDVAAGPAPTRVELSSGDGRDALTVVAPDATGRLLVRTGDTWQEAPGPEGALDGCALAAGSLWCVTGSATGARLWRTTLAGSS